MSFVQRGRQLPAVLLCLAVTAATLAVVSPARAARSEEEGPGSGPLGKLLSLATSVRGAEPQYVNQLDPMAGGDAARVERGVFMPYEVTDERGSYLAYVLHPTDAALPERLGIAEETAGSESLRFTTWQLAERGAWESPVALPSTNVANGEILGMDPNEFACGLAVAYLLAPTPLDTIPIIGPGLEFLAGAATCWVIMNLGPVRTGLWWVDHFRGTEPTPLVWSAGVPFTGNAAYRTSSEMWCGNVQDYAGQAYIGNNGVDEPCLVQAQPYDVLSGWKSNVVFSKGRIMWPDGALSYELFDTTMYAATNPYFNSNNSRPLQLNTGKYLIVVSATTRGRYEFDGSSPLTFHENQEGSIKKSIVIT